MKKIIFLLLATIAAFTASATTFTIDVDNAANVEVGYNYSMWGMTFPRYVELQDGINNVDIPETSFFCKANSPAVIDEITKDGVAVTDFDNIAVEDGVNIVIRTHVDIVEGTCTVNCDEPSQVSLFVGENQIPLTANTQTIDFIEGDAFTIENIVGSEGLASVKLNGEAQSASMGGAYYLYGVKDGDVIDIKVVKEQFDVTFTFSDDAAREYITSVEVNNEPVSDYESGLRVDDGSYVTLKVNESITNMEVRANGEVLTVSPFFHDISFTVSKDTEVTVTKLDVPEPQTIVANVNVDNAQNVDLYYLKPNAMFPWMTSKSYFNLVDGENEVEIPEGITMIYAKAKDECELTSVKLNGEEVAFDASEEAYPFEVSDEMNIVITSKTLTASASFTLICADPSKISVTLGGRYCDITDETEQTIAFIPETNPNLIIEAANNDEAPIKEVLHNDQPVSEQGTGFGGSPYYEITDLQDGDKVEVLFATTYNVTFSFGEGADESYIEDVVLGDSKIDNYKEGFSAPEGSIVMINVNRNVTGQKIFVNGEAQEPNEYNFVTFTVVSDTEVVVAPEIPMYSVTFNYAEGADTDFITRVVVNDTEEENFKDGLSVPEDAMVYIYVNASIRNNEIAIDDTKLTPDENSCVSFRVTGNSEVVVKLSTSILSIMGIENGVVDVYTTNGILVKANASSVELNNLDAGIYIINGKKVMITK
ncbi:MAG: hypothetical protein K2G67_05700 [Muribaculaceae bacterium]|nr:hypothetical protein [Muribaculaceae bacterium]